MKFTDKVKLQHSNQLLVLLLSNVYSAEVKINWTVKISTLQEQRPAITSEYANNCVSCATIWCATISNMKFEQQSKDEFKAKHNNLSLLQFSKLCMYMNNFPILRRLFWTKVQAAIVIISTTITLQTPTQKKVGPATAFQRLVWNTICGQYLAFEECYKNWIGKKKNYHWFNIQSKFYNCTGKKKSVTT